MFETKKDTRNSILRLLESEVYGDVFPHLTTLQMEVGETVHRAEVDITHVYFPETSVISVVTYLSNGDCVETGIVGNDGMTGTEFLLGETKSARECMIQLSGTLRRMRIERFKEMLDKHPSLKMTILRYVYSFITQISQNQACLAYHRIEKRLARWLLMFHDRADGDMMNLTQEFIAVMLGVQRPSVSLAAEKLQKREMIKYNRGRIQILDRAGLEAFTCECYKTILRKAIEER